MQKPMTMGLGVWPLLLDRQTKCRTVNLKLRRRFARTTCDSHRLFSYLTTNDDVLSCENETALKLDKLDSYRLRA